MQKRISIIIATYNASKTLRRCLDSIILQKNDDVEIVIVDGLSNDGTVDIIKSYGANIDYFISEKDNGIYDAWNKALKIFKGEWIMFLGSDDYLMPESIQIYLNTIAKTDSKTDIISGRCLFCDEEGNKISTIGKPYVYNQFRKYMNISHGSTLHNRRLFEELGEFDLNFKICADYDFLLRRPMKSVFIDREMICMQSGGISFSIDMIVDTFKVKRKAQCSPLYADIYYFAKGVLSLMTKKLLIKFSIKY